MRKPDEQTNERIIQRYQNIAQENNFTSTGKFDLPSRIIGN
jgi:hypothetical protein